MLSTSACKIGPDTRSKGPDIRLCSPFETDAKEG